MPESMSAFSPSLSRRLNRFCDQLQEVLGDSLESIVLYGGLAKGDEYTPQTSDVNVMVILSEVTVEALDSMASPIRRARRSFRLSPFVLSRKDLESSMDVFPIKFLDIKHHHRILRGEDLLTDLPIDGEHLRLRCEQELKNLLMRLRSQYLQRTPRRRQLSEAMTSAISPFLHTLNALLLLKTSRAPVLKGETARSAAKELGLDEQTLNQLLILKRGDSRPRGPQLKRLFEDFITTVGRAAELADELQG